MPANSLKSMLVLVHFVWALVGITLVLLFAIFKTSRPALELFSYNLSRLHITLLIIWLLIMLVGEGYYGFQKGFVPRVTKRLMNHLHGGRPRLKDFFAPLQCLGFIGVPPREMLRTYSISGALVLVVVLVSGFTQPFKGIINAGVVAGLTYGLFCLYAQTARKLAVHFTEP